MNIDLSKGLNLRVEGEVGKYNTLPIDYLIKLASNLQKLIQDIADNQLEVDGAIDLSNFNIELSGFRIGSAVPEFTYTKRIKGVTSGDVFEQRDFVNNKLKDYLEVANEGDYAKIKTLIPQAKTRNLIVEDIYNFASTFGNSPLTVVDFDKKGKIIPLYKIRKFKTEIKERLLTKITEIKEVKEEFEGVAKIKVVREGNKITRKIQNDFVDKHADTSYRTEVITYNGKVYELASPLRCKLELEEDYYIIESEMLDIVGAGKTINEAEANFSEGFDYIYTRYNQLKSNEMSDRIKRIKTILNSIVIKID